MVEQWMKVDYYRAKDSYLSRKASGGAFRAFDIRSLFPVAKTFEFRVWICSKRFLSLLDYDYVFSDDNSKR